MHCRAPRGDFTFLLIRLLLTSYFSLLTILLRRYIIVLFMVYDANRMTGRPRGYTMSLLDEKVQELAAGSGTAGVSRGKGATKDEL